MKHQGPSLVAALVASVVIYILVVRKRQAAAAAAQALNVTDAAPLHAGAPVPNLSTALALEQDSLLSRILTSLRGGTTSSSSSSTHSIVPVNSTTPAGQAAGRQWIHQQQGEGAVFRAAANQGYVDLSNALQTNIGPIPSMSDSWAALTGDTGFPVYGDAAKLEQMYLQ